MPTSPVSGATSARFTFKGNLRATRHGWLRLTPAYSVQLVRELLEKVVDGAVLDPFCGTGTTLLACAEAGIRCTTVDLNPFLVWLARAKCARYTPAQLDEASAMVRRMARAALHPAHKIRFTPGIYRIDRWWDTPTLEALSRSYDALSSARQVSTRARDLSKLAFCRTLIDVANVSFGHQSMSFRKRESPGSPAVAASLTAAFGEIAGAAHQRLATVKCAALVADSRSLAGVLPARAFRTVVTSPPYPNRMSYVRELRPYMYWLGYLSDRREAGQLDWKAIGGTWGVATSNLNRWNADPSRPVPHVGFERLVRRISRRHTALGRYVHKYFEDMTLHVAGLARVVDRGGVVHYVVGNSKFFDVVVPVPEIFGSLFEAHGFRDATITCLRKRSSKKELFEYLVTARRA